MARKRKLKCKQSKKPKEECETFEVIKVDEIKKPGEKSTNRVNIFFKSEEIQEICSLLNVGELVRIYYVNLSYVIHYLNKC